MFVKWIGAQGLESDGVREMRGTVLKIGNASEEVEGALRNIPAAGSSEGEGADEGQIVIIRPRVVEDVGHVLGNLFQRIYHLISQIRNPENGAAVVDQLEASTRQLEDFLQLVIDYVSPLYPALQYVAAAEAAQSLARQISDAVGCPVKVDARLSAEGQLLVDPGRLARSFGLLAMQLRAQPSADQNVEVHAVTRPPGRSLTLTVHLPHRWLPARTTAAEIQWAVAKKFLETHGGTLEEKPAASGEVLWEIVLPLQS